MTFLPSVWIAIGQVIADPIVGSRLGCSMRSRALGVVSVGPVNHSPGDLPEPEEVHVVIVSWLAEVEEIGLNDREHPACCGHGRQDNAELIITSGGRSSGRAGVPDRSISEDMR